MASLAIFSGIQLAFALNGRMDEITFFRFSSIFNQLFDENSKFSEYSGDPNTGQDRYLNGLFQLVPSPDKWTIKNWSYLSGFKMFSKSVLYIKE